MKKLFFTFVLIAAVATCFMSCEKTVIDSDTHTQKFIFDGEEFDIENAFFYIQGMNYESLTFARSGSISVERDGDIYAIDMPNLEFKDTPGINVSGSLHYVGTMPRFDIPFLVNSNN